MGFLDITVGLFKKEKNIRGESQSTFYVLMQKKVCQLCFELLFWNQKHWMENSSKH